MARPPLRILVAASLVIGIAVSSRAAAEPPPTPSGGTERIVAHWTPERIAGAQPRDLVVDHRGLGYLRGSDGGLRPYGHDVRAQIVEVGHTTGSASATPVPKAPPSSGDSDPPTVGDMSPADGDTIGGSARFSASITDSSGVKSVSFVIVYPGGNQTQAFTPSASGSTYSIDLQGFSDGAWGWYVVARDNAKGRGNEVRTPTVGFTVDTSGGGGGGGSNPDVVTDGHWTGGDVQLAAGRILFEMPQLRGKRIAGWVAYVCSGTAVTDSATGRSLILTAAHCVYDDAAKVFARNVLFIPGQDDGGADGTDANCGNDPIGCWVPSHGVVDDDWTTREFPANVEWDFAFYVVPDAGAHVSGRESAPDSLAGAVNELSVDFGSARFGEVTHALGYSYAQDPQFRYCKEAAQLEAGGVDYWLPSCELTGGSSGGPWVAPMDEAVGTGPIVSVNSWGYTNQPGMAGPFLEGTAACVFAAAESGSTNAERGMVASCA